MLLFVCLAFILLTVLFYLVERSDVSPSEQRSAVLNGPHNLTAVMDLLHQSRVSFKFRGKRGKWTNYKFNRTTATVESTFNSAAIISSDYCSSDESREMKTNFDLLKVLREATSEGAAQAVINQHLDKLKAVDCSKNTNGMFSIPRRASTVDNFCPASALIDVVSTEGALTMEIKVTGSKNQESEKKKVLKKDPKPKQDLLDIDFLVLAQALDRIFVVRTTNATLKSFIVLAVTDRSAWIVEFIRDVENFNDSTNFESIRFTRIEHEHVWDVWFHLQARSESNPYWYLTQDGPHILSALNSITNPFYCSTKLVAMSQHRVYKVSFPKVQPNSCGVSLAKSDLYLKVINNTAAYKIEAEVGQAVCAAYNIKYPNMFHIIGWHCMEQSNHPNPTAEVQTLTAEVSQQHSEIDDFAEVEPYDDDEASSELMNAFSSNLHFDNRKRGGEMLTDNNENEKVVKNARIVVEEVVEEKEAGALASSHSTSKTSGGVSSGKRSSSSSTDKTISEIATLAIKDAILLVHHWNSFFKGPPQETFFTPVLNSKYPDPSAWRRLPVGLKSEGGVVLMRVGEKPKVINHENNVEWLKGVYRTLRVLHACGYAHTDIRPSNVLKFKDGFQVIDFGCAVKLENQTCSFKYSEGGRYDARPVSLHSALVNEVVEWTPSHDFEMAATCLL